MMNSNFSSNSFSYLFPLDLFQSGMYWLQLVDKYAANWSVLLIAIAECILISWVYGANRFLRDIQDMIGQKSWIWTFFWTWMWKLITPATLLVYLRRLSSLPGCRAMLF
jgi:SNF family Na+-dependent transporter